MYYAQIGTDGKVHTVWENENTIVGIESNDERLLGTFYVNGNFVGYRIGLTTDKSEIVSDGEDTATITATVTTWDEQIAAAFSGSITFVVDGQESEPVAVVDGVAELEFTAEEPGSVTITATTDNPYLMGAINSVEIEVVVGE